MFLEVTVLFLESVILLRVVIVVIAHAGSAERFMIVIAVKLRRCVSFKRLLLVVGSSVLSSHFLLYLQFPELLFFLVKFLSFHLDNHLFFSQLSKILVQFGFHPVDLFCQSTDF